MRFDLWLMAWHGVYCMHRLVGFIAIDVGGGWHLTERRSEVRDGLRIIWWLVVDVVGGRCCCTVKAMLPYGQGRWKYAGFIFFFSFPSFLLIMVGGCSFLIFSGI